MKNFTTQLNLVREAYNELESRLGDLQSDVEGAMSNGHHLSDEEYDKVNEVAGDIDQCQYELSSFEGALCDVETRNEEITR